MEFATAVAGSKLVIVLGHTARGAVNNTIDKTDAASLKMNALQKLLEEILPLIARVTPIGEISSKNEECTNQVI